MENITASELAGLGVGTLLFCATIAAPKVDAFISASQRTVTVCISFSVYVDDGYVFEQGEKLTYILNDPNCLPWTILVFSLNAIDQSLLAVVDDVRAPFPCVAINEVRDEKRFDNGIGVCWRSDTFLTWDPSLYEQ
ncbi:hypothetical protein IFM89_004644, partial [Coptis chinensis]